MTLSGDSNRRINFRLTPDADEIVRACQAADSLDQQAGILRLIKLGGILRDHIKDGQVKINGKDIYIL